MTYRILRDGYLRYIEVDQYSFLFQQVNSARSPEANITKQDITKQKGVKVL